VGQCAANALEERPADAPQRIVHTLSGTAAPLRYFRDARTLAVTFVEKVAIVITQLGGTLDECLTAIFDFLGLKFCMGVDQQQVQLIREIQALPAAGTQEVGDLETSHAARPGEKVPLAIIVGEFLPQDQSGLLEQVVGVIQVAQQRMDVAEELRLMLTQQFGKLQLSALFIVHEFPFRSVL
jgi:hypothetical protein